MGVHQKLFTQQKLWRLYLIALNSNIYIKFQFVCFFSFAYFPHSPCTATWRRVRERERTRYNELLLSQSWKYISKRNTLSFFVFVCFALFHAICPFSSLLHTFTRRTPNFLVSLVERFSTLRFVFHLLQVSWLIYINLSFNFGFFIQYYIHWVCWL